MNVKKNFMKNWQLWVMIAPLLVWLAFFAYKPMYGILIAFQDFSTFRGIAGSEFVGLKNFTNLMFGASSQYFWRAAKNTVKIREFVKWYRL